MADGVLHGKTALVTGAASGLGRAMALGLLGAGARVAFTDISEAAFADVSRTLDGAGDTVVVPGDLTQPGALQRIVDTSVGKLGPIDILVNNAGISPGIVSRDYMTRPVRFWEHDERSLRRFFDVNVIAPTLLAIILVHSMKERGFGRIINVTTSLDTMMRAGFTGYGGSKAGLEAHAAIMAADLAGTGITVNVLVPGGPADTPMVPAEAGFDRSKLVPAEKLVPPAVWLASDESRGVTGRRFLAAKWDGSLPGAVAAERAGAPIAWLALTGQAVFPEGYIPPK